MDVGHIPNLNLIAVLPSKHCLTHLIIEHIHTIYFHPGVQIFRYLIRQLFWILAPKCVIRRVISKCLKYWYLSLKIYDSPMGNIPKLRISKLNHFPVYESILKDFTHKSTFA